jgi:hypothetical protein
MTGVRLLYALAIVNLVLLLGDVLYNVLGGLLGLVTMTNWVAALTLRK